MKLRLNKFLISSILSSSGLLSIAPAHAFFDYQDEPTSTHKRATLSLDDIRACRTTGLLEKGTGDNIRVSSFGNSVPFVDGVRMIIPTDWRIAYKGGVPTSRVTWSKNVFWVTTLSKEARKNGLCAQLDWHEKSVLLERLPARSINNFSSYTKTDTDLMAAKAEKVKAANEKRKEELARKALEAQEKERQAKAALLAKEKQAWEADHTWILNKNKTLHQNLSDWSKKAGWTLIWSDDIADVDYKISAAFAWKRVDFKDAVYRIMKNYRYTDRGLKVKMHKGNKVIVISGGYK